MSEFLQNVREVIQNPAVLGVGAAGLLGSLTGCGTGDVPTNRVDVGIICPTDTDSLDVVKINGSDVTVTCNLDGEQAAPLQIPPLGERPTRPGDYFGLDLAYLDRDGDGPKVRKTTIDAEDGTGTIELTDEDWIEDWSPQYLGRIDE